MAHCKVTVNFLGRQVTQLSSSAYRGADKSYAQLDWKSNWKVAIFRQTKWSLLPRRPGWTDNLLNFFFLSGLQKSYYGRCTLFPSWSG